MNRYAIAAFLALGLGVVQPAWSQSVESNTVPLATVVGHNITLKIEPVTRTATVRDRGMLTCGNGWHVLFLTDSAAIETFFIGNLPTVYSNVSHENTGQLTEELRGRLAGLEAPEGAALLLFDSKLTGSVPFEIAYTARFADPVEDVQFSREKVGNEVTGTILEKGAYLSGASCFYPQGAETMARFALEADIPATWTAIGDGNPVSSEVRGDRKIQSFENPFSSDGYVFMAAPYLVKTNAVDSITVATYFFEEDSALCDRYLTASADYIRMYQDLIGPYPFKQFTVAGNFFPTGYGMPGWTLLGQQVLRLPFIISTSLGHEVLHNWWGNSVYVDYDKGNWCEGLTVYGADYRYKLLASPEAARDYRKDILKDYLSYVNDGNDFPIRKFTSRSSAETRTVGYNKAMMVFHLIEEQIGTEAFFDAWKQVYQDYRGHAITWEDWINVFQQTSGQNLEYIIPEWIDRAGAPQLGLEVTGVKPTESGDKKIVSLKITQSAEAPYHLRVPIRAEGPGVDESSIVALLGAEVVADFEVPVEATTITLDPDYHLFRRLYPEEVEPIISAVLGVAEKGLVSSVVDEPANAAFAAFGSAIIEDSAQVVSDAQLQAVPRTSAPILLNPSPLPDYIRGVTNLDADSVTVGDQSFPREGHTVVMAGQSWEGFDTYLVVLTNDYASLPRLGQLVPHYGKYSYLVFAGAKNVAKGQWPVTESPLRKTLP